MEVRSIPQWRPIVLTALFARRAALDPAELQREHLARIYRYAYRRIGCREDAEDVTAEVFAAAFAGLSRLRGSTDPGLWLLGIARRKVADYHRRSARRAERSIGDLSSLGDNLPCPGPTPEESAIRADAARAMRAMLAGLPGSQREALLLKYVERLTTSEVAEVLGCSPAAANSLLQRARAAAMRAAEPYLELFDVTVPAAASEETR